MKDIDVKKTAKEIFERHNPLKRMTDKQALLVTLSAAFGLSLLVANVLFISRLLTPLFTSLLDILSVIIIVLPFSFVQYSNYKKKREIETKFPTFITGIVEGLRGNMTLTLAIKSTSKNNYGPLTPYIDNLVAQISWGIPFDEAFENFTKAIDSSVITRAVSTIIQTHHSGGDLTSALESISSSVNEIEKLKRERFSRISGQMIQGYIIFFVFLGVMIGIKLYLIPAISSPGGGITGPGDIMGLESTTALSKEYAIRFRHLAALQGFFAGTTIGKLSEGMISAGLKHALILGLIGFTVLTIV